MDKKNIILKPLITEKTTNLSKNKVYSFIVNEKANKNQIKKLIEEIYKVKVYEVKVVIRKGKIKRKGRRMLAKRQSNRKIAYVKLKEGKIDIFPES